MARQYSDETHDTKQTGHCTATEYQQQLESEISNLRQEQARLEKTANLYRHLYDQAPTGFLLINTSGIILDANPSFVQMLDTDLSRILQKPFFQTIHHQDRRTFSARFKQFLKNFHETGFDIQLNTPGIKTHAAILLKPIYGCTRKRYQPENIMVSILDISEKKKRQETLQRDISRLNTILTDLPAMICVFKEEGSIFYSNKAFLKNYCGSHSLRQNFFSIISNEMGDDTQKKLLALSPTHPMKLFDYEISNNIGLPKWQRWIIRAIFHKNGNLLNYQAVGYDISEPKKAHREEKEKERIMSLMELSGAICHELRQPLQILVGLTDLIKLKISSDTALNGELKQLQNQTIRIDELLKRLEHITRYETKTYAGASKIIDLKNASDRRKSKRYMTHKKFLIRTKENGGMKGQIIDISRGGVSFWSDHTMNGRNLEASMKYDIMDPSGNIMIGRLPCRIVRSGAVTPKQVEGQNHCQPFGMTFSGLTKHQSDRLVRFIMHWRAR